MSFCSEEKRITLFLLKSLKLEQLLLLLISLNSKVNVMDNNNQLSYINIFTVQLQFNAFVLSTMLALKK
jgi:hypothetical protein